MVNVILSAAGARGFGTQIDRWTLNLRETGPVFNKLADFQAREWTKQFNQQGGYLSEKWAPLSPEYRRWKAAHFPGQPILVRTGRLRRSLTSRPLGIEEYSRNQVRLGTDVPYAQFHQRGTKFMPRRQIYQTTSNPRQVKAMVKIMQRWIVEGRT